MARVCESPQQISCELRRSIPAHLCHEELADGHVVALHRLCNDVLPRHCVRVLATAGQSTETTQRFGGQLASWTSCASRRAVSRV